MPNWPENPCVAGGQAGLPPRIDRATINLGAGALAKKEEGHYLVAGTGRAVLGDA